MDVKGLIGIKFFAKNLTYFAGKRFQLTKCEKSKYNLTYIGTVHIPHVSNKIVLDFKMGNFFLRITNTTRPTKQRNRNWLF